MKEFANRKINAFKRATVVTPFCTLLLLVRDATCDCYLNPLGSEFDAAARSVEDFTPKGVA